MDLDNLATNKSEAITLAARLDLYAWGAVCMYMSSVWYMSTMIQGGRVRYQPAGCPVCEGCRGLYCILRFARWPVVQHDVAVYCVQILTCTGKADNDPAGKLAKALQGFDPSSMQEALRRPGSVDFAVMIAQLQQLQNAAQGTAPETTPEAPPKPIKEVLPPTRPGSPAPPPLAQLELPNTSPLDVEEAAKAIEVGHHSS